MRSLNLGWATAWKGALAGLLFAGGGGALCAVSVFGLPGRDPSQRALGVIIGLVLLLVGVLALVGAGMSGLRISVDGRGATLRQRKHGELSIQWDELTGMRLLRENRRIGRVRAWFYTLELTPAGADFAARHPELDLWREGERYRYDLGQIGQAGRRLDRELARVCPQRYRGLTSEYR